MPELGSFPTVTVLDPQLRVAVQNIQDEGGDAWLEQLFSRMAFMVGGSLDSQEICGDGVDNDLNMLADCMDPACAAGCQPTSLQGTLGACGEMGPVWDTYDVDVNGEVVTLSADTIAAENAFDIVVMAIPFGEDWANWDDPVIGDDEQPCTHPLAHFACALGWLRPGRWTVAVRPGASEGGDCVNPDEGGYALTVRGDASAVLLQDDLANPLRQ